MTDYTALPESWPEPPTDPPDDDPDAPEAEIVATGTEVMRAADRAFWQHDCDEERCPPCVACNFATGETVCQFTCEHRRDLE